MPISDATLMAYIDGELDVAAHAQVRDAIAADALVAQRVQRQVALRARVQGAFDPLLAEPVPERLLQALQPAAPTAPTARTAPEAPTAPPVARLDRARAAKASRAAWASDWRAWGGMAASVLVGVLIGMQMRGDGGAAPFAMHGGQLVARGAVDQALSTQLASAPLAAGTVQVQLSFIDRTGAYCRSFTTAGVAGLACQRGSDWAVQSLVPREATTSEGLRQAATALPPAILGEIDRRIQGDALDAQAERAALLSRWRR